jgi:RNA polymerase sigma-70 factor, ECF subfamily
MNERECPRPGPSPEGRLPIDQYLDRLFAYAYRLTGSYDLAEDLTQQTFLVAHQRGQQLRDPDKLGAWLMKILRNSFLKSRRRADPVAASQLAFAVDSVASEEVREAVYDEELLRTALTRLPDEFRVVVLMFYFEELSYRQIAQELDLPVGTVMSRLSRAKGHLRRMLVTPEKLTS